MLSVTFDSKNFLISVLIFQKLTGHSREYCPVSMLLCSFLLLISNFIILWPGKIQVISLTHSYLVSFAYCSKMWFVLEKVPLGFWEEQGLYLLGRILCRYLLSPFDLGCTLSLIFSHWFLDCMTYLEKIVEYWNHPLLFNKDFSDILGPLVFVLWN